MKEGSLDGVTCDGYRAMLAYDTQEVLDNLTGSNMANVGVVYPVGLLAFLLGSSLLGAG